MRAVKSEIVAIRVLIRGEIDNKVVCVKTAIRSAKAVRSLGESSSWLRRFVRSLLNSLNCQATQATVVCLCFIEAHRFSQKEGESMSMSARVHLSLSR